ncbi:MAG: hypothetical protein ABW221_01105 [Vicinamibacteria bacterium]
MSLKRPALALAFLSCTLTAAADTHKIDGEAAFSYVNLSNVFGFKTSFARTLGTEGPLHRWAVEGQFTGHFLGDDDSEIGAFLGPRYSWGLARYRDAEMEREESKRMLFVHALGGVTHRTDAFGASADDPALALGGGLDLMLGDGYRTGVRLSFDYVVARGENYPRASVGLVYRVPYPKGAHTH